MPITRGAVLLPEQTAPATPAAGRVAIYAKSDGKVYIKDDAGTETDITTPGGGAAFGLSQVEVNLGAPAKSGRFTISDGAIAAGTRLTVIQAADVPTGKGTRTDENEMDVLDVTGSVTGAGTALVYWSSRSFVKGNMKFNYRSG